LNEYPRYAVWAAHMAQVESALIVLGIVALAAVSWTLLFSRYPRLMTVWRVFIVVAFYASIGVCYLWLG